MWAYATCGMSKVSSGNPIELHLFSAKQDRSIVELLTATAFYHQNDAALDLHHTVNFGRGWQDSSTCEYGLISLPYLHGPDLENGFIPGYSEIVKFYWLVPITKRELEFKKQHGVEELEIIFEKKGINYLNSRRESLI